MTDDNRSGHLTGDSLVAGTVVLLSLWNPIAAVVAGIATPVASAATRGVIDRFAARRRAGQEYVIKVAAEAAGIDADELDRRCAEDPELEELLANVLGAASDTSTREKLIVYALALAAAIKAGPDPKSWQAALVAAIRDLGPEHFQLLDRFTRTTNQLGLADGSPPFDVIPLQLTDFQVETIGSDLSALRSDLAGLQRHGLLEHTFPGGGATLGIGSSVGYWVLTDFGSAVHDLLTRLSEKLSPT